MSPFVPPPAQDAPYRALPISTFSRRVKFLACVASAIPFFGLSILAPIVSGVGFLLNYSKVIHSHEAQHRLTVIAIVGFLIPVLLALIAAAYRLFRIQMDEWTIHPPVS
jgi:hypothetical protein